MKTYKKFIKESIELTEEKFQIGKFISACKKQKEAFDESGNKEGSKFLDGILKSYEKNGSLSPDQVQAASKYMKQ